MSMWAIQHLFLNIRLSKAQCYDAKTFIGLVSKEIHKFTQDAVKIFGTQKCPHQKKIRQYTKVK